MTVEIVDANEWEYGEAMGVYRYQHAAYQQPLVEAKVRPNQTALTVTLVHEYTHTLFHNGVDVEQERAKREVEARRSGTWLGGTSGLIRVVQRSISLHGETTVQKYCRSDSAKLVEQPRKLSKRHWLINHLG